MAELFRLGPARIEPNVAQFFRLAAPGSEFSDTQHPLLQESIRCLKFQSARRDKDRDELIELLIFKIRRWSSKGGVTGLEEAGDPFTVDFSHLHRIQKKRQLFLLGQFLIETERVTGLADLANSWLEVFKCQSFGKRLGYCRQTCSRGIQINAQMRIKTGILNLNEDSQVTGAKILSATALCDQLSGALRQPVALSTGVVPSLAPINGECCEDDRNDDENKTKSPAQSALPQNPKQVSAPLAFPSRCTQLGTAFEIFQA